MSDDQIVQNDAIDSVLRQVSGQLRNSLTNIYSSLERLTPPDRRDMDKAADLSAAILTRSCYSIMRLADNLEDAANLNQPVRVRLVNGDIAGLCRRLTEEARVPAELLGLDLTFRCAKSSCIIAMDVRRMERLVLNLLSNAFKFTPRGGKVGVEVRPERERVLLLVSDTGCGIPEEMMDTLFERYLCPRMEPPPHGLGLGLHICRLVAEEHGGTITPLQNPDGGTIMTVSLPRRKAQKSSLEEPPVIISGSSFNRILVELSDALPKEAFTQKYMD